MADGKRETICVTRCEQPVLAAFASAPDRAHRVNDVAGREPEARGDLRFARGATVKQRTCLAQFWPCGAMDGAIDPAAAKQCFVGGVDDGVDIERCDVAFDDLDALGHDPIGDAGSVPIKSCY